MEARKSINAVLAATMATAAVAGGPELARADYTENAPAPAEIVTAEQQAQCAARIGGLAYSYTAYSNKLVLTNGSLNAVRASNVDEECKPAAADAVLERKTFQVVELSKKTPNKIVGTLSGTRNVVPESEGATTIDPFTLSLKAFKKGQKSRKLALQEKTVYHQNGQRKTDTTYFLNNEGDLATVPYKLSSSTTITKRSS